MNSPAPQQDTPPPNNDGDRSDDDYHAPERGFLQAVKSNVMMFLPALIVFLVGVVVILIFLL